MDITRRKNHISWEKQAGRRAGGADAPVCSDSDVRVLALDSGRHGGGRVANVVTHAWDVGAAAAPASADASALECWTHLEDPTAGNYDSIAVVVRDTSSQTFHGSMRLADVLHILPPPHSLVGVVVAKVDRAIPQDNVSALPCRPAAVGAPELPR